MSTHGEPKPTSADTTETTKHLEALWRDAWKAWDTKMSYYRGTFQVWTQTADPSNARANYHLSYPAKIVDGAVNTMLAYEPKPHAYPTTESETEKENANLREKWLTAVFARCNREQVVPIESQVKRNLMALGWACVKGPIAEETKPPDEPSSKGLSTDEYQRARAQWENETKRWNPIRLYVPNPKSVLVDPLERNPSVVIERNRYYVKDLQALLEKKKSKEYAKAEVFDLSFGDNPYGFITCVERWTAGWHSMALADGGNLLFVEENGLGYVPFVASFTGWGAEYLESSFSSQDMATTVAQMSKGILDDVMDSLLMDTQRMNATHDMLMRRVYRTVVRTTGKGEDAVAALEGGIAENTKEGDLGYVEYPDLPRSVFEAGASYERDIERGTYPSLLLGQAAQGVTTLGAQALLRKDAAGPFGVVVQQMAYMWTVLGSNMLRLVDELGEDITQDETTLRPQDVGGNYSVKCEFLSADPVQKAADQRMAMIELEKGLISKEDYYDKVGTEDSTGIRRRILLQKSYDDPEVQGLVIMAAKMSMGLEDLKAQMAELQARMAPPAPASPAVPGLLGPDGQPIVNRAAMAGQPTAQEQAQGMRQGIANIAPMIAGGQ